MNDGPLIGRIHVPGKSRSSTTVTGMTSGLVVTMMVKMGRVALRARGRHRAPSASYRGREGGLENKGTHTSEHCHALGPMLGVVLGPKLQREGLVILFFLRLLWEMEG